MLSIGVINKVEKCWGLIIDIEMQGSGISCEVAVEIKWINDSAV